MSTITNQASPVSRTQRIFSLDFLRGIAVLGILLMNIRNMSMIEAAYLNPTAYGNFTGLNKWVWMLEHILAEQKFMALFSILFGAGIVLFTERIQKKDLSAAKFHYRRTFWLLIIGLVHAYLLWHGDILVSYALCALFIYPARKLKPRTLVVLGLLFLSIGFSIYLGLGSSVSSWPPDAIESTRESWAPPAELVRQEVAAFKGGFGEHLPWRIKNALFFQTFIFLIWAGWRVMGLMLLGMAMYKANILNALRTSRYYRNMAFIGFFTGLPLIFYGLAQNFAHNWTMEYSMFTGSLYNYVGSLLLAMGYIGGIVLISKHIKNNGASNPLAAVGRMALSNYLGQTLICTLLMYGHGLGWYGSVSHAQQLLIVLTVWTLQLVISPLWLRYFRFGPVEWLWRSLTYAKLQPMRIQVM